MIILVTGWRYSRESEYVAARLGELVGSFCLPAERIELVHGDCHLGGVDKHADTWGQAHAWKVTRFPASRYGSWPECGPLRNKVMVDYFDKHYDLKKLALAFPQRGWRGRPGGGTRNCIETLQVYGYLPFIYEVDR